MNTSNPSDLLTQKEASCVPVVFPGLMASFPELLPVCSSLCLVSSSACLILSKVRNAMAALEVFPFNSPPASVHYVCGRCMPFRWGPPGWWLVPMPHLETMSPVEAWTTSAPYTTWRLVKGTCGWAENYQGTQVSDLMQLCPPQPPAFWQPTKATWWSGFT